MVVMSKIFEDIDWYAINYNKGDACNKYDSIVAENLSTTDELDDLRYHLYGSDIAALMPLTKAKINIILANELSDIDNIKIRIDNFTDWLDNDTKLVAIKAWLSDHGHFSRWWITRIIGTCHYNDNTGIRVLDKMITSYRLHRTGSIVDVIRDIFTNLDSKYVEDASAYLSASTPAIQACLLSRTDISESSALKGLKALGKLSAQKEIKAKINLQSLSKLGPVARLNAMRQLLGMFDFSYIRLNLYKNSKDEYYRHDYYLKSAQEHYDQYGRQKSMPFKEIPSREEISQFLFPCSLKFNKEVSELMSRYDELTSISTKEGEKEKRRKNKK
jgi:hypothetical protein